MMSNIACEICGKKADDGWAIYRTSPKGVPFIGVCAEHNEGRHAGAPDVAGMIEESQRGPRALPLPEGEKK